MLRRFSNAPYKRFERALSEPLEGGCEDPKTRLRKKGCFFAQRLPRAPSPRAFIEFAEHPTAPARMFSRAPSKCAFWERFHRPFAERSQSALAERRPSRCCEGGSGKALHVNFLRKCFAKCALQIRSAKALCGRRRRRVVLCEHFRTTL